MSVRFGGKSCFPKYLHINFNLAHCKSAAMAVISDKKVGCDIEEVLTKLWTRKEALVKDNGNIPDDPTDRPSVISSSINIFTKHQIGSTYVYSIACVEAMP